MDDTGLDIGHDAASRSLNLKTNNLDRLTILGGGNVGIGEQSPSAKLQITTPFASSPSDSIFLFTTGSNTPGGGSEIIFGSSTSATPVNYNAKIAGVRSSLDNGSSDLWFQTTHVATATTPTTKIIIKSDGKVGIGTDTPSAKLHVEDGNALFQDGYIRAQAQSTNHAIQIQASVSNEARILAHNFNQGQAHDLRIAAKSLDFQINGNTSSSLHLSSSGLVTLGEYGSGTYTGTAAYNLQVDSSGKIIETVAGGGGTINGSGAANRVALWSDSDTLTSDGGLTYSSDTLFLEDADYTAMRINASVNHHSSIEFMSASVTTGRIGWHNQGYFASSAMGANPSPAMFINAPNGFDFAHNNTGSLSIKSGSADVIVDSKVKLGIGVASPSYPLHVYSGGSERFAVSGDVMVRGATDLMITGTSRRLNFTAGTGTIRTTTSNNLILQTNSTDALTIDPSQNATFAGNVLIADNKNLDFGAATDFRIVHNSTTNVNHISSKLDRQLSLNANIINLTNQANDDTVITVSGSRVGIGETSPDSLLHIKHPNSGGDWLRLERDGQRTWAFSADDQSGNKDFSIEDITAGTRPFIIQGSTGNVGIKDSIPTRDLTVNGDIGVKNSGRIYLWDSHNANYLQYNEWVASASAGLLIKNSAASGNVTLAAGNQNRLFISASGNIGIGTTDPQYAKLQVNGSGLFSGTLQVQNILNLRANTQHLNHDASAFVTTLTRYTGGSELGLDYDFVRTINATNGAKVGIGGVSANYRLGVTGGHIGVSNGGNIYVGGFAADAVIGYMGNSSGVFTLRSDGNRDISIGSGTVNSSIFIEGSNGNVGIGTTTNLAKANTTTSWFRPDPSGRFLTMHHNSGSFISLETTSNTAGDQIGGLIFNNTTGQGDAHVNVAGIDAVIVDHSSNNLDGASLRFFTKPAGSGVALTNPQMLISSTGYVGIGTTSPGNQLEVNSGTTNITSVFKSADNQAWISIQDDASGTYGALIGTDSDTSENFVVANASAAKKLSLTSGGVLKLYNYGSGAITGTATKTLQVDSNGNVIENSNITFAPKVEYQTVSSNIAANATFTLPNSLSYTVSSGGYEYLEVFLDGIRLNRGIDFQEISTTSIKVLMSIPATSVITYKSIT